VPTDPPQDQEPLWIVTGPSAAGKSALALELALRLGCEVLSMDSMAIYRRMDIGTAKPSASEQALVPHHLIDLVEPSEDFDTARWCAAAAEAAAAVRARGRRPLFVGGTPLYLMAFFKGMMPGPSASPALRASLREQELAAPGWLHRELQRRDPDAAERIHPRDEKRLVRALEVIEQTGRPISAQQTHFERRGWLRPCRIAAISRPRDELHARVRARAEAMLERGLLDETRQIRDSCGFSRTAAAAIGYAECLQFLQGRIKDREELRNRIRRSTHRLIRRQTTWLRRLPDVRWLQPDAGVSGLSASLERPEAAGTAPQAWPDRNI
jgi:tRNA dimethylallyltransferase